MSIKSEKRGQEWKVMRERERVMTKIKIEEKWRVWIAIIDDNRIDATMMLLEEKKRDENRRGVK